MRPHCLATGDCAAKGDGHCRQCWGKRLKAISTADPDVEARRRAGRAEAMRAYNQAFAATPEGRKALADRARKHGVLLRPEVQAKAHTPELIAARTERMRAARNALPAERRYEISSIGGRANAAKDATRKARLAAQIARFAIERQEREQRERRDRERREAY